MNGNNIIGMILETCTFPADFTENDRQKFAGECASAAGRYFPDAGSVEEIVTDVGFSAKQVTVKFGAHKVKAEKGHKIAYNFRLSVWLGCCQLTKLATVTGYNHTLDLVGRDFWNTWERAEVTPEPTPEPKVEEVKVETTATA